MRLTQNLKRGVQPRVAIATIMCCLGTSSALGAYPVIHVAWEEPGGPPVQGTDYEIYTTDPNYPDVELITGSDTWQVWSTDPDNPGGIGDIGEITSPHDQNYGLKIEDDLEGPGARYMQGIVLDPTDPANYSNLTGSITGGLAGDLFLQRSSGGQGGICTFSIGGYVSGAITIPVVDLLTISSVVVSTAYIDDVTGSLDIGFLLGSTGGSLTVTGDVSPGATITVDSVLSTGTTITFGMSSDLAGTLNLPGGLGYGQYLYVYGTFDAPGEIDLGDVSGWVDITSGSGAVTAGTVTSTGMLSLATGGPPFTGTAHVASVESGGYVMTQAADLTGHVHILGDLDGTVALTGPPHIGGNLLSGGSIEVGGAVTGYVTVQNAMLGGTIEVWGSMDGNLIIGLGIGGDVAGYVYLYGGGSGDVTGGTVVANAFVSLSEAGPPFTGTAEFSSVDLFGYVVTDAADLNGLLWIKGDVDGGIGSIGPPMVGGNLLSSGRIQVDGDVTGYVIVQNDVLTSGRIEIGGDVTGDVTIGGDMLGGPIDVWGSMDGEFDVGGSIAGIVYLYGAGSGDVTGGTVAANGMVSLSEVGPPFTGTARFSTVDLGGYVFTEAADLDGLIQVYGDLNGMVGSIGPPSVGGNMLSLGRIQIDGDVIGNITIQNDMFGGIIEVWGSMDGNVIIGLGIGGDVGGYVYLLGGGSGDVTGGTVVANGLVALSEVGPPFTGTAEFSSVDTFGYVVTEAADLDGLLWIKGDVDGGIGSIGPPMLGGNLLSSGRIQVDGDVNGFVIVQNDMLASAQIQIDGNVTLTGDVTIGNDMLGGILEVWGSMDGELDAGDSIAGFVYLIGAGSGYVTGGTVAANGLVSVSEAGPPFTGEATFDAIDTFGYVITSAADVDGLIHVLGNVAGGVFVTGTGMGTGGNLLVNGVIQIDGDLSGYAVVMADSLGAITVGNDVVSTGTIEAYGDITGPVTVYGIFNGNICASNLSPDEVLPGNIDVTFGPTGTVCGGQPCIAAEAQTVASGEAGYDKNRYFSFVPNNAGGYNAALRVTLTDLPVPFESFEGQVRWVGQPVQVSESPGSSGPTPLPNFWAAQLQCEPFYWDWSTVDTLHVYGVAVVPNATYDVAAIRDSCDTELGQNYSTALPVPTTAVWGDVVGDCGTTPCTPPNGIVNFNDIYAVIAKFQGQPGAPIKSRADVAADPANQFVNISDIQYVMLAFQGSPYPFGGPQTCP